MEKEGDPHEFFDSKFIRNWEQTSDPTVRKAYGTLSSVVGMLCNIVLFALKYSVGVLSNSIAIISDAFNNLSDCASCLVTLFGYKLAAKPPTKTILLATAHGVPDLAGHRVMIASWASSCSGTPPKKFCIRNRWHSTLQRW